MLGCGAMVNEWSQFANRTRPQRATTGLVSLSTQENGRAITARCGTEFEVVDPHLGHFVSPSAGVVQEQKHLIGSTALRSTTVGGVQQCIQLVLLQVPDQWACGFLRRDGLNLTDQSRCSGL